MRIAALDDDPLQLELVRQVVTQAGHSCHTYSKGSALQLDLRRESFDLLLVDWELPDIQGTQIVRWVREQISKDLPIIFVTHRSEEADIVEGDIHQLVRDRGRARGAIAFAAEEFGAVPAAIVVEPAPDDFGDGFRVLRHAIIILGVGLADQVREAGAGRVDEHHVGDVH